MRCMSQTATGPVSLAQTGRMSQAASGLSVSLVPRQLSTRLTAERRHNCSITRRPRLRAVRSLPVLASSARADEPSLVRQSRPSWNYKLGAVYQHFLPGPLLFLPSLLQPISTIISLEGALHGHEWVHWLLSLLPVPQVQAQVAYLCLLTFISHYSMTSVQRIRKTPMLGFSRMPGATSGIKVVFGHCRQPLKSENNVHRWSCSFQS